MKNKEQVRAKLEELIQEDYPDLFSDNNYSKGEDLNSIFYELEDLLSFLVSYNDTVSGSGAWLQAEYYSEKLGKTIIIEYNMNEDYEDIDSLMNEIERLENEIIKIESKIK